MLLIELVAVALMSPRRYEARPEPPRESYGLLDVKPDRRYSYRPRRCLARNCGSARRNSPPNFRLCDSHYFGQGAGDALIIVVGEDLAEPPSPLKKPFWSNPLIIGIGRT